MSPLFTSGQTTNTNTYSPQQTAVQNQTLSTISNDLSNPNAQFAPIEAGGLSSIDQSYQGVLDQMNKQLASRGFTNSGTTGYNTEQVLSSEAGAKGNYESGLATSKLNEQNSLLSDAMNAAYKPSGSTSTTQSPLLPTLLGGGLSALLAGMNSGSGGPGGSGGVGGSYSGVPANYWSQLGKA